MSRRRWAPKRSFERRWWAISTGNQRRNCRTSHYRKQLAKLPSNVAKLADVAFALFLQDPYHAALHNKQIDDSAKGRHRAGTRSVWVTYRYRALYMEDGDANVWYWIGSHEDYNDFIGGT